MIPDTGSDWRRTRVPADPGRLGGGGGPPV